MKQKFIVKKLELKSTKELLLSINNELTIHNVPFEVYKNAFSSNNRILIVDDCSVHNGADQLKARQAIKKLGLLKI